MYYEMQSTPSDLQAALDAGHQLAASVLPERLEGKAVALPQSMNLVDVRDYDDHPHRAEAALSLHTPTAFIQYVNRFGNADHTIILADRDHNAFNAVIDYHGVQRPGWRKHKAALELRHSREWGQWAGSAKKWFTQRDFIDFLEENARDIVEPSSARMLEVASDLEGNQKVAFRSSVRLDNGDVEFGFVTETTTGSEAKGRLAVPRTFTVEIPVFEGADSVRVEANLRYRIAQDGQISFSFVMPTAASIVADEFEASAAKIEEATAGAACFYRGN